jgi:hypothetical protein
MSGNLHEVFVRESPDFHTSLMPGPVSSPRWNGGDSTARLRLVPLATPGRRCTVPLFDRWLAGIIFAGMALYLFASLLLGVAPHERWRLMRDAKRARAADDQRSPSDNRRAGAERIRRPRIHVRGKGS